MDYTVAELNPGANDGWYEIQGLKVPLLNNNVMFDIDYDPTKQDAAEHMKKALLEVRTQDKRIVDGDWFNTPIGKFMAQSPSILTEDEANGRAAKMAARQQTNQPQSGAPAPQQQQQAQQSPNPNTVNLPQAAATVTLNIEVYIPASVSVSLTGQITVRSDMAHYNNYLISEIDKYLASNGKSIGSSGYGNVLNVIDFPDSNGGKTMLVGYDKDTIKVVIEVKH